MGVWGPSNVTPTCSWTTSAHDHTPSHAPTLCSNPICVPLKKGAGVGVGRRECRWGCARARVMGVLGPSNVTPTCFWTTSAHDHTPSHAPTLCSHPICALLEKVWMWVPVVCCTTGKFVPLVVVISRAFNFFSPCNHIINIKKIFFFFR